MDTNERLNRRFMQIELSGDHTEYVDFGVGIHCAVCRKQHF